MKRRKARNDAKREEPQAQDGHGQDRDSDKGGAETRPLVNVTCSASSETLMKTQSKPKSLPTRGAGGNDMARNGAPKREQRRDGSPHVICEARSV